MTGVDICTEAMGSAPASVTAFCFFFFFSFYLLLFRIATIVRSGSRLPAVLGGRSDCGRLQ